MSYIQYTNFWYVLSQSDVEPGDPPTKNVGRHTIHSLIVLQKTSEDRTVAVLETSATFIIMKQYLHLILRNKSLVSSEETRQALAMCEVGFLGGNNGIRRVEIQN